LKYSVSLSCTLCLSVCQSLSFAVKVIGEMPEIWYCRNLKLGAELTLEENALYTSWEQRKGSCQKLANIKTEGYRL